VRIMTSFTLLILASIDRHNDALLGLAVRLSFRDVKHTPCWLCVKHTQGGATLVYMVTKFR